MLQIIDIKQDNVVATIASGKLQQQEIEKVHPIIHTILDKGLKIRWYIEMNNFEGWSIKGLWEDFKMDVAHEKDYERIAMVGEKKWQEWAIQFMEPFTNANIKYFEVSQKEDAKKWIERDDF
ncbi:SpoIIAA family protein [Yeosuana sp.]|uniref:SpoIIAA family protein n=1 Tax=Yeosuana sp. TaxID=2529388 RepID=UPI004054E9AA